MSDTPRTDAVEYYDFTLAVDAVSSDFARDLERENSKLRRALADLLHATQLGLECQNFHHKKSDRHKHSYDCPCLVRWQVATRTAEGLLTPGTGPKKVEYDNKDYLSALWCLSEVLESLPEKRDWLNPDVERTMQALVKPNDFPSDEWGKAHGWKAW